MPDQKECPICRSMVDARALKCIHCQSYIGENLGGINVTSLTIDVQDVAPFIVGGPSPGGDTVIGGNGRVRKRRIVNMSFVANAGQYWIDYVRAYAIGYGKLFSWGFGASQQEKVYPFNFSVNLRDLTMFFTDPALNIEVIMKGRKVNEAPYTADKFFEQRIVTSVLVPSVTIEEQAPF